MGCRSPCSPAVYGLLGPTAPARPPHPRAGHLAPARRGHRASPGSTSAPTQPRVRARIGLAGQSAAVDEVLTGRENVEMVGQLYGLSRRQARQRASQVLERIRLLEAADRQVKTYSGGMRRRLDLGASLVGRP